MKVLEKMKINGADLQNTFKVQPVNIADGCEKTQLSLKEIGFTGISTDSRTIKKGDLFFALKGENYNGHDFISQAVANGAAGIVISEDLPVEGVIVFKVEDTLGALGDLAAFYRRKFNIKSVAITGSNGKTTTKEMLAACLQTEYSTFKTAGNFNNLIGLPLTLFNLDESCEVGVFELGMSVPGEMTTLAKICQPQVGVFTNIAPAHLETMGSVDKIARAKYELVEQLPNDGVVILNNDDSFLSGWIEKISQKVITYGIEKEADFKVNGHTIITGSQSSFRINRIDCQINYPGKHNIYNAAAAIAAACCLGCNPQKLVKPLSELKAYHLRSEVFLSAGVVFIDDCYNANPVSMENAIDALADYRSGGRKVAVLGDMFELGDDREEFHIEIGYYLNLNKIDALFAYGELSKFYMIKFQGEKKEHFKDKQELIKHLRQYLNQGDVVLVKGSRGMAMEEITIAFKEKD